MKTELIDVDSTRKELTVEVPSTVVEDEVGQVASQYRRRARVPGFRPGKVPVKLVRQMFRDQILQDVAQVLVPRSIRSALVERAIEPVDQPRVTELNIREGEPLTFKAAFEIVPPIDPGDYGSITLRRKAAAVEPGSVEQALERLRNRVARFEPVEGRPAAPGDTLVVDLTRRRIAPVERAQREPERHDDVSIEIGASANPPGFDEHLVGLTAEAVTTFTVTYPADHAAEELAGAEVAYEVHVHAIKQRVMPDLDDEFAKDVGDFASLEELRTRVATDLQQQAEANAERELRNDLLKQVANRVSFEVPDSLVERELERRTEEFVRQLVSQGVDPRNAPIDWDEFRDRQRDAARETVRSVLVLDEVARREQLTVSDADLNAEVARYAARTGQAVPAARARLEKEDELVTLHTGLRREKAIDFLLTHATLSTA